jgi:hypothetical protein
MMPPWVDKWVCEKREEDGWKPKLLHSVEEEEGE